MDLGDWLRSLGLGRYEAVFRENEIDTVLPSLTAEDLKDLGDAPWRRPAKQVETHAADVANRYAVALLSIDVDDCPELARRYQVAGVPSLLFFRNGQVVARRTQRARS